MLCCLEKTVYDLVRFIVTDQSLKLNQKLFLFSAIHIYFAYFSFFKPSKLIFKV
jgi:hypothetical protein